MEKLARQLATIGGSYPFTTRWHVRDIASGRETNHEGDVPMPSASTRKTSILMAAMAAVNAGVLRLEDQVVLEARLQKDVASGTYRYMTP